MFFKATTFSFLSVLSLAVAASATPIGVSVDAAAAPRSTVGITLGRTEPTPAAAVPPTELMAMPEDPAPAPVRTADSDTGSTCNGEEHCNAVIGDPANRPSIVDSRVTSVVGSLTGVVGELTGTLSGITGALGGVIGAIDE